MSNSIERVELTVGDATYPLAPLETVKDLEAQVLGATRSGGGFVKVTLDGGQRLSIFVSATSSIVISSRAVELDGEQADGRVRTVLPTYPDSFDDEDDPYNYI